MSYYMIYFNLRTFTMRGRAVVARLAHNQEAGGAIPPPATKSQCSSGVEQQTHKLLVAGSNPATGTM